MDQCSSLLLSALLSTIIIGGLYNPVEAQLRPRIIEHPADAVAAKEEPLTLNCKAAGRPPPEITWYHNGSPLGLSDRRVILPEGSLFFLKVMQNKREQDAGVYHCEAQNSAGVAVSRNATLQIAMLKDEFRAIPKDTVALVGGPVILNCTPPRGIPEPSVLWIKDGKLLDISGKRLSMVDSGSLMISEIQPNDTGKYECSAQSMAGTKTTPPAYLKVLAPPTIVKSPHDTEVLEGEGFDLPCELAGDPKPVVTWRKESGRLPEGRSRKLLDNTLRIEDARQDDEGKYICEGHNEGGNVTISVYLYVYEAPTFLEAPVDVVIREGEGITLPCRAKGRPTVRILWDRIDKPHVNNTSSGPQSQPLLSHKPMEKSKRSIVLKTSSNHIRSFAPESFGNWSIKIEPVSEKTLFQLPHSSRIHLVRSKRESVEPSIEMEAISSTVPSPQSNSVAHFEDNGGLTLKAVGKGDEGWYACAAINEAGSIVKKIFIKVLDKDESLEARKEQIHTYDQSRWVSEQFIVLNNVFTISASSIGVSWDVTDSATKMPLRMYYRIANEPMSSFLYNSSFESQVTTSNLKEFTLNDLRPFTEYEIFASIPEGLSGSVSNIRQGKTLDGAPSAAPTDVRVGVINTTAAFVRWSPPPTHLLNGELTGYKIQIKSNATNKVLGQMVLNSTTQSVVINSLTPGGMYIAKVASLTAGGIGPYSLPTTLHMDPQNIVRTDPTPSYWMSSWMSGTALVILCVCLIGGAVFAIFWTVRKKQSVKASYPGPSVTTIIPDKQHTLWLHGNTLVKPSHSLDPPSTSEYAELTNNTQNIKNNTCIPPEPYATVTLQRGGTVSEESCMKCSPVSSEYNAPLREPINISDVLPPPPDHPYGTYRPPMTIRTNPAALSPQMMRKNHAPPPMPNRWDTMPPPIPSFPQNWIRPHHPAAMTMNNGEMYSENDYESGSVLYEQCFRPDQQVNYFSQAGEPTEEFYRHMNMEFAEDMGFEPASPPAPCPETPFNSKYLTGGTTDSPIIARKIGINTTSRGHLINSVSSNSNNYVSQHSAGQSSESDSDNRWAPARTKRSRSRSKSSDRKYNRTLIR
ncbi:roundabout homolog 2 [Culex quinquefasciatus]|nr:roundabout homolog 2 [Culex quinquefasciatus]XP_038109876.1 roundabout homolog 2 [Culex quinquefasciatus]XP_038109877.1 roundabout homolog 2 [Culex quinquefasciatus]XP_038109878.1 roundabout homolog 2 [Culex quinquefasciatus]XP_039450193.1 roundabout homolog 2-like [Culex pipiens pallens]XP_039450194.1 roundabout homolog 2-like [Culex pipiens pallens]